MNILSLSKFSYLCISNPRFIPISFLSVSATSHGNNLKKQVKVFEKLLGERKSSKKWYKNMEQDYCALKFESSGTTQTKDRKWDKRRINALNKIFMMHITDLMSTGSIAELIQGKEIQITRVKMSIDFTHLNILWTSKVDCSEINNILLKCAGMLRHELSQLRVVGEVPNIKFVRDKTDEGLMKIHELLDNINKENIQNDDTFEEPQDLSLTHDIFGLDRQMIINKIRSKLKKSAEAWENHKSK
ncbi:uncharacterized protein LOC129608641 [Condylostylus longicornis]|uniref:uncharacterized protein LOC129608641 n=1 Tax=Condylostylus longicornis TaxID=2530218 RepID=UPI00244DF3E9|nr:uncharacterized protein LOC129608641 [Condylostylus longicornis]